MKAFFLTIVLALITMDPIKIGKINRAKEEAKKAYAAGDYETATTRYKYLTDSLRVNEDEVLLNLAHAYYRLNDTTSALGHYQNLTQSSRQSIRSTAQQQLGVIKNKQGKFEEALAHFKEAIKSDPTNEDARYNYELLKRKLDEQKKQDQDQNQDKQQDQQKDQQKKDDQKQQQDKKDQEKKEQDKNDPNKSDPQKEQQGQDQKDEKNEKGNKPSSQKLEQMKISEEKAKMLLEAMKNQEVQYLQQNKRKATQPKDRNKPDW